MKFEYILTLLLILIISAVIFINPTLEEAGKQGFTALIGVLSGATGFIFGIRQAEK